MDELQEAWESLVWDKPPADKPTRVCWGCQREEKKDEKFSVCERCEEYGFRTNFCSHECFAEAWPRHKKWHTERKKGANLAAMKDQTTHFETLQALAERSDYDALAAEGSKKMGEGDFLGAKKLFRKAQKLDTRRPEAYFDLYLCYLALSQRNESYWCLEQSGKRCAFIALTGYICDAKAITKMWAGGVCILSDAYKAKNIENLKKPNWWSQDGLLKTVTKLAYETVKDDPKASSVGIVRDITRIALSGVIRHGEFATGNSIPENLTADELEEASELLREVTELDPSDDMNAQHLSFAEILLEEARKRALTAHLPLIPRPRVGAWVFLHGLTSPSGMLLNGKLGLVVTEDHPDGRLAVKVDGQDDVLKLIRPSNILELPAEDRIFAFVACLDEIDQWKFMRTVAETIRLNSTG